MGSPFPRVSTSMFTPVSPLPAPPFLRCFCYLESLITEYILPGRLNKPIHYDSFSHVSSPSPGLTTLQTPDHGLWLPLEHFHLSIPRLSKSHTQCILNQTLSSWISSLVNGFRNQGSQASLFSSLLHLRSYQGMLIPLSWYFLRVLLPDPIGTVLSLHAIPASSFLTWKVEDVYLVSLDPTKIWSHWHL